MPGTRVGAERTDLPWTSGWALLQLWVHWPYHWSQISWWLDQNFLFSRSWDLSTGESPENCLLFQAEPPVLGTVRNFSCCNTWIPAFWVTGELFAPCFLDPKIYFSSDALPLGVPKRAFLPREVLTALPQALLGKAFVLWSATAALRVEMLRWTYLSSPARPTLSLHKQLPCTSSGGSTYFRETLTSPSLTPSVGRPSPDVSIDLWDSVQRWEILGLLGILICHPDYKCPLPVW